ncbi:MAG: RNHCP domain-containing protein [Candidatus Marsarchaeota archaeon]|jgi:Zn finger protein HypA/HybF involved in hydrogenase expression|nr:RNHCP domain-containing protein [Candidatus Marsarchaeota archaeon]
MGSGVLPTGRFTRRKEDFTCGHCGTEVHGTGYTDHCPKCLYSMHVDIMPGDRENGCGGLMRPASAEYRGGSYVIHYVCEKCKARTKVHASGTDSEAALELLIGNV